MCQRQHFSGNLMCRIDVCRRQHFSRNNYTIIKKAAFYVVVEASAGG